jgi:hypothetical protein
LHGRPAIICQPALARPFWPAYEEALKKREETRAFFDFAKVGKRISQRTLEPRDPLATSREFVDLSTALHGGHGQVLVHAHGICAPPPKNLPN